MKKLLTIIGILALAVIVIYSQRTTLVARLMERGLEARMGADVVAGMEDGLHLALCGAGGPMPAPNASGPCVAVVAGKQLFIVDAGTDGVRNPGRVPYSLPLRPHRRPG
jgi:ribonuclease Z